MATLTIIEERNRHAVRVVWTGPDGETITPTSVRYRLDCLTTGTECIGWTSVTPTSTTDIQIPSSANSIRDSSNMTETKEVAVQADAGLDTQITARGQYVVANSRFFT